jgi:hypothetical protein
MGKHGYKVKVNGELSSLGLDKGSRSEAAGGPAGQSPVEQRIHGTPMIGEVHISCSQTSENLDGLTEKVGTLGHRLANIFPFFEVRLFFGDSHRHKRVNKP